MNKKAKQLIKELKIARENLRTAGASKKDPVTGMYIVQVNPTLFILTDAPLPPVCSIYVDEGDVRANLPAGTPDIYYFNNHSGEWESLIDGRSRLDTTLGG